MSYTGNVITGNPTTQTVKIDTNLSSKEGYAVNFDATDQGVVNLASASTSIPYPLKEGGDGSSTAVFGTIITDGNAEVIAGGNVAPGNYLTSDANGKWVVATSGNFGAIALKVGVANDKIPVQVRQGQIDTDT